MPSHLVDRDETNIKVLHDGLHAVALCREFSQKSRGAEHGIRKWYSEYWKEVWCVKLGNKSRRGYKLIKQINPNNLNVVRVWDVIYFVTVVFRWRACRFFVVGKVVIVCMWGGSACAVFINLVIFFVACCITAIRYWKEYVRSSFRVRLVCLWTMWWKIRIVKHVSFEA